MKRRFGYSLVLIPILVILSTVSLYPQANFVYTNNNIPDASNTVSAFSVAANGALTQIAGSPFTTGGSGGPGGGFHFGSSIAVGGNYLFVCNIGSANISVFSIDPATGSLTLVPGSPFPTGYAGASKLSLAVAPNNQFLYVTNLLSVDISAFRIDSNGALTPVAGSPFFVGTTLGVIKVVPNGRFLVAALRFPLGNGAVDMFSIAANGALTPVPGSPFPTGGGRGAGTVEVNCASDFAFVGEGLAIDVFRISANGALTPIPGSPFDVPSSGDVSLLSPNDQFLFISGDGGFEAIQALNVASNGALTPVSGSPFLLPFPDGMATNQAGTFLYVAHIKDATVSVFSISSNGALTSVPGSPFPVSQPAILESLAAFPAKVCETAPLGVTIDIKPGGSPNSINPSSNGNIPVAVLTTKSFDATSVDPSTVRFGRTGQEAAPLHSSLEDVDGDGDLDLVLHFTTQQTGILCGDSSARLTGKTFDGQQIEGSDSVRTVGCKK